MTLKICWFTILFANDVTKLDTGGVHITTLKGTAEFGGTKYYHINNVEQWWENSKILDVTFEKKSHEEFLQKMPEL